MVVAYPKPLPPKQPLKPENAQKRGRPKLASTSPEAWPTRAPKSPEPFVGGLGVFPRRWEPSEVQI